MKNYPSHNLRIDYLDLELVQRVLAGMEHHRKTFVENEKQGKLKIPQRSYAIAYVESMGFASYKYALGDPIAGVCEFLAEAGRCVEKVFELRGTQPPFPVTVVEIDPTSKPNAPRVLSRRPLHDPNSKDYSLTNSVDGLSGMYISSVVGNRERARRIAEMVWDPPDATYIGHDSEICTPDQQHLAYAVKHALLGDNRAAFGELGLINHRLAPVNVKHQVTLVRSVLADQREAFVSGLKDLLVWHRKMALRKSRRNDPDYFICIAGLGLCAVALRFGLLSREKLPGGEIFLPLDLIHCGAA